MINKDNPLHFYETRIKELETDLSELETRQSVLGWLRLIVFVVSVIVLWYTWPVGPLIAVAALFPLIALFFFLVSISLNNGRKISHTKYLIEINEEEKNILSGKYHDRYDGAIFTGQFNSSDSDLDIYGHASLYQYVNRATSDQGRHIMATYFSAPADKETILKKQQAVQELQKVTLWRQQLQALGMNHPVTRASEQTIVDWAHDTRESFDRPVWHIARWGIPLVSLSLLGLYIAGVISSSLFFGAAGVFFVIALFISKKVTKLYGRLSKIIAELETLVPLLQLIESTKFESSFIQQKQALVNTQGKASASILQLKKILDRFDYRLNPLVHVPLNTFLLWDLQQAFGLERWRARQTEKIAHWYEAVGEMEALSSLATLAFNQPGWTFPEITDNWFEMECQQSGHPLIAPSKLVKNDFSINYSPQIVLVTGSNMAGKSTFLRALGTNILLSMAGAPVCATYMKTPVTKVMSSMRIMDNLDEATSTFYAELKKLKAIIEAVQRNEKVFLLLDEMLRGTNSIDRHAGSAALIRQLIEQKAVGIIASHDISLADMEKEYPRSICNYHFDSSIINEEIVFDYKLKPGICESTNATLLMKKIGIRIEG